MRLIDADEMKDELKDMDFVLVNHNVEDWIDEQPTVDAEPVLHGHWDDECRCTACGWYGDDWYKRDAVRFSYCPNCGAKMDGE